MNDPMPLEAIYRLITYIRAPNVTIFPTFLFSTKDWEEYICV